MNKQLLRVLLVNYADLPTETALMKESWLCDAVQSADIDVDSVRWASSDSNGAWTKYFVYFSFADDNSEKCQKRIANDMDKIISALSTEFPEAKIGFCETDGRVIVVDFDKEGKQNG